MFFFLTWLQSWIIHYSDLPDTPLPPFPPHHFFFLSSLQLTPITGSKTLPRKLSDSQEIKGVSRRLHAYLLLDESQLLFDEYLKEKNSILGNCRERKVYKEIRLLRAWKYFKWIIKTVIEFGFRMVWRKRLIWEGIIHLGRTPLPPIRRRIGLFLTPWHGQVLSVKETCSCKHGFVSRHEKNIPITNHPFQFPTTTRELQFMI